MKIEYAHLLVRKDEILCCRCYNTEPVNAGHGTPMSSLFIAYEAMAGRHQYCGGKSVGSEGKKGRKM